MRAPFLLETRCYNISIYAPAHETALHASNQFDFEYQSTRYIFLIINLMRHAETMPFRVRGMIDHTVVLRWNAYEHEHVERGSEWFWALGVAAVCAALTAILLSNLLFAVVILVAAFTIALLARNAPEVSTFEVSVKGIRVDKTLHRYDEIISFWVEDEHDGHPLLLVDTIKLMSPNLIIPIHDIDPGLLRAYLKEHAHEVHMKEPLAHKILEFFGI